MSGRSGLVPANKYLSITDYVLGTVLCAWGKQRTRRKELQLSKQLNTHWGRDILSQQTFSDVR